ncbi:ABC transporter ATP-binding protein [Paludibacterium sp.]|uniref:ATP-binding cassette domain-containing protein n=1 Tax=Paludibacterium sp. TaxID=1917523 RepID=UPI0025D0CC15|nr:ABC transporter ATP-binding protein [Paludibacterium sp.]MBV8647683.1 ABC transporter ATP-binding protein [Paludibacterium sp.]
MNEPMPTLPLIVERLTVRAAQGALVDGISFCHEGGLVALVGESGSGKTMTARALLGLTPRGCRVEAQRLLFRGQDLLAATPADWRHLRGRHIGLVQQDPRYALNPVKTVAWQVEEGLRLHHRHLGRRERRERVEAMLTAVGLTPNRRLLNAYPHHLSGGMGQRVMLAASLISEPALLIADEPTSALDEALRRQALDLIASLAEARGMAVLLISHDLPLVAHYCRQALVMRHGALLETLPAGELAHARHPYTQMLWRCQPSAATYGQQLPVWEEDAP